MPNNTARKTPSIQTLIRDGYLMELAEGYTHDEKEVAMAKLHWMDDYAAYLLDELNDE